MTKKYDRVPQFMEAWKLAGKPLDMKWFDDYIEAWCPDYAFYDNKESPCDACSVDEEDCKTLLTWRDQQRRK